MSTELLLLEDVDNLGKAGDVVRVAPGYARNFLVPKGVAEPVTEAAKRRLAKLQAEREAARKAELEAAQKLAAGLKDAKVTIRAKVGEDGENLYGSVDAAQIAEGLKLVGFPEVEPSMVKLEENIKTIGTFDVEIKVHPDVAQVVKVWVVAE
ncbi:MAG: 50S ribosomal protein L9 [Kiritimatiellae bacterium]|nr:50S ribosomal protein L9 [Kiritimatiellia bacterium]